MGVSFFAILARTVPVCACWAPEWNQQDAVMIELSLHPMRLIVVDDDPRFRLERCRASWHRRGAELIGPFSAETVEIDTLRRSDGVLIATSVSQSAAWRLAEILDYEGIPFLFTVSKNLPYLGSVFVIDTDPAQIDKIVESLMAQGEPRLRH